MTKIPVPVATRMIALAYKEKTELPYLRLGQALWTLLVQDFPDLADQNLATSRDFFYTENDADVMYTFMTHFVEVGNDRRS